MRFFYHLSLISFSLCVYAFTNPIKLHDGSDPAMVFSNGFYYLTTTAWSSIQITRGVVSRLTRRRASQLTHTKSIEELKTAAPRIVQKGSDYPESVNMWAPEFQWVLNKWHMYVQIVWNFTWESIDFSLYSYYTAKTGGLQGIHVLEGSSNDIWESSWRYLGRIKVPNRDVWSIDPTILFHPSGEYLVFSSWEDKEQCLWIAKMSSQSAITIGDAVKISRPSNDWERLGGNVNEGPSFIYKNGRTWLIYSASSCAGRGYSLGRIELIGSDPLKPSSWKKYDAGPVFKAANHDFAVGHNGFFTALHGDIFIVFHASPSTDVKCDGSRQTFVQPVGWHSDGTPNLGIPLPTSQEIQEPK
ncbi:Glycoside hydrolase family 43 protein [Ceratobasidium theobromae]|uniref:Glycoside hydrolase family 43 protein n=1 Tax=Ceratobasidium theobromae TaxID=1582974 RepID=A0A5N5Q9U6_9AGAM|nr:Glycoside hydrolase family 43 protein [Ceratobasidium theobromae]